MDIKQKLGIKIQIRNIVLVHSNQDAHSKRFKTRRYDLPKEIIGNYKVIVNGKNFDDQPIDSDIPTDSDIKWYEKIRRLTTGQTGQGADHITGCLPDYDNNKNHYRLIVVDLRRQKKLDADPKAIQQIEFVGQLKNVMLRVSMEHKICLF